MGKVSKALFLVLLLSLTTGCFIVVMNRRFEGKKKEQVTAIHSKWGIRTPLAEALVSCSNKLYWDWQEFNLWIPFTYGKAKDDWNNYDEISAAFKKGDVGVDSVTVIFLTLRDTIIRHELGRGSSPQGLFSYDYYYCVHVDSLIIPAEEDSIDVKFTVEFRDSTKALLHESQLSYRLWRREGKKLFLDVGK